MFISPPRSHKTPSASESMSGNVGRCVFFRMFYWPTNLYRYYLWSVFDLLSAPPEQDLSVHRVTSFPLWPCILMLYMSRLGRLLLWACASFCFIVPQLHNWRPLWKIFHWASPCPVLIYDSWASQIFFPFSEPVIVIISEKLRGLKREKNWFLYLSSTNYSQSQMKDLPCNLNALAWACGLAWQNNPFSCLIPSRLYT